MKLMVLDGNSIVNRAFYGVSQNLTTRDGQPTNAIFGFLNILIRIVLVIQRNMIADDHKQGIWQAHWRIQCDNRSLHIPKLLL